MLRAGDLTQLEWIDACANELMLDGVDLSAAHFPRIDDDYLAQIKKLCVDRGLTIACVSADEPLGGAGPRIDEWRRRLEIAQTLGAPLLRAVCAGSEASPPAAWRDLVRSLKEICAHAKRLNVTIALQPDERSLVAAPADVKRLLKECDSAWLRLALAASHLASGGAESWEPLLGEAIIIVADIHRLDTFGADETIDYRRALAALWRTRYRGFLSIEYDGEESELPAVARAAAWLRGMLANDELQVAALERERRA